MKIALVSPDPGGGGIYRFYKDLTEGLEGLADCHLLTSDPFGGPRALGDREFDEHTDTEGGTLLRALPTLLQMVDTARDGWQRAVALEPDIIEVCDWPLGLVPAVLGQEIPYVVQCHGSMGQIAQHDPQMRDALQEAVIQLAEPELIRSAHRVTTYSQQNADFWERMAGRKVAMIYPAYAPPPESTLTEPPSDRAAVFGRLQRWKGPHVLCAALQQLGEHAPTVDWYGAVKPWSSMDWPTDRRLATDFPSVWGTRFQHKPAVPLEVVARLQATALFNVVPSTWDMFNFTAVEAMGAGRPTIVSTGAGASELIVDGDNGFVFENENPDSLAAAIERVMTLSEARRREIGRAGRETVEQRLHPAAIAEQRLTAYQEAIQAFHDAPPAKPNPWISELLNHKHGMRTDPGILLDLLPVRAAAGHVKDRLLQKLGWKRQSI